MRETTPDMQISTRITQVERDWRDPIEGGTRSFEMRRKNFSQATRQEKKLAHTQALELGRKAGNSYSDQCWQKELLEPLTQREVKRKKS